jgi:branched-chain amino acid transport system substrate-binding protein
MTRRRLLQAAAMAAAADLAQARALPVQVGLDAEFGLENSTSAQAIELGLRVAIAEVNAAGGVLGGRPLELLTRDNHSMPARSAAHLKVFAAMPELVAVFGGKFSPVMIDAVPVVHELGLPLLAVWSSADPIVDNGRLPNYVFRLALRDSLAMPKMLTTAHERGLVRVGLLLANTGWGRSNLAAAESHVTRSRRLRIAGIAWHNWGERSLLQRYLSLREAGAQAVVVVTNDDDAAILVREVAALPPAQRLPLICHQGITGGKFALLAGPALQEVDLSVLQTFSFFDAEPGARTRFFQQARSVGGLASLDDLEASTGTAHAYDMLHLLALAIGRAGSTQRPAVRDALERLPPHRGLIKHYRPAFTPQRHEALGPDELLLARYRADGVLVPIRR